MNSVTPEMLKAAQQNSELGSYVCANWAGAYDVITELYNVMASAVRQAPASGEVEPPCDCIEKENGYWHQRCDCRNSGDLASAQSWCDEANRVTHPPAKVPEGLIDAVQNLGPFEKDFGANFNDEFGVYHCNYCNARYEQDLCEKPELDHAEDCPVVKLRQLLTTPTPATTPETESCEWREDEGIWSGECGVSWWFEDGTPKENKQNFCPNCGKPCVQHEPQEQ